VTGIKLDEKNIYQRVASSTENKINLEGHEKIATHFNPPDENELHIIVESVAGMSSSPLAFIIS
jgi:hypothetical protein